MKVEDWILLARARRTAIYEAETKIHKEFDKTSRAPCCKIQRGNWAAEIYFEDFAGAIVTHVGTAEDILDRISGECISPDLFKEIPRGGMTTEFNTLLMDKFNEALAWVQGKQDNFPVDDCARKPRTTKPKANKKKEIRLEDLTVVSTT